MDLKHSLFIIIYRENAIFLDPKRRRIIFRYILIIKKALLLKREKIIWS